MHILIFTDTFLPQINGVVTHILETSKRLARRGHKILIFAPKSGSGPINLDEPSIEVVATPSISLPTYKEYKIALPRVIREYRKIKKFSPDIIHVHSPFSLGLTGLVAATRFKKPIIGTYHTFLPDFLEYYLPLPLLRNGRIFEDLTWRFSQYFYNRCNLVITPSQVIKSILIQHGIEAPIKVLSNGIDLAYFKPDKSNAELIKKRFGLGRITLIHSGRISFEKNPEVLIKAFKKVKDILGDEIKFLIIGDGPALGFIKKLVEELDIEKDVIFAGYQPRQFMIVFLSVADIFITASTMETQGLVVLEAMASGLAVIGPNKMALPELIRDGVNGYLFEAGNDSQLAQKMIRLIKSKKLRDKMSKNSIEIARQHSIEKTVEKLEKIYAELTFSI